MTGLFVAVAGTESQINQKLGRNISVNDLITISFSTMREYYATSGIKSSLN
jgi:hypothetical protein